MIVLEKVDINMKNQLILILLFLSCQTFAQNSEYNIIESLQQGRNTGSDKAWDALSQSADYTGIIAPFGLLTVGFIQQDENLKWKALSSGVAVIGTYGAGYIMKKAIKRDRPFVKYPEFIPYRNKDSYAMPSGSTALAFTTATSLTMALPKWYVALPSYAYAGAIGYSRIHLAEHYPTDVLAGAVLGSASAFVCYKLNRWVNKK